MRSQIRPAIVSLFVLSLITGVLYPLAVTGLAQLIFPDRSNGSLIVRNGEVLGSELIGQLFNDPKYFWGRPSATAEFPYNAAASTGSNLALTDMMEARIAALRDADPGNTLPIPVDLVTASGSGLDPHISVAAALYQAPRVARVRGIPESAVIDLVNRYTEGRQFGFFGEPRVNVLLLNLALDGIQ